MITTWQNMDIFNQMGNVASELGRDFHWKAKGNKTVSEGAFTRALGLLDAIISDPKNVNRGRELQRSRELFCADYLDTHEYNETPETLEEYFMHFAR